MGRRGPAAHCHCPPNLSAERASPARRFISDLWPHRRHPTNIGAHLSIEFNKSSDNLPTTAGRWAAGSGGGLDNGPARKAQLVSKSVPMAMGANSGSVTVMRDLRATERHPYKSRLTAQPRPACLFDPRLNFANINSQ